MVRRKAMGPTTGLTCLASPVAGLKTRSTAMECISGPTAASLKAAGKTIICMVVARTLGRTVGSTMENTSMIRSMDRAYTLGAMGASTTANGPTANNTAKVFIDMLTVTAVQVSGTKAKEPCGSMINETNIQSLFKI